MRAWKIALLGVALGAAAAFLGCDQMEPIDQNFDSSLGADFRAPVDAPTDAGATDAATAASATP